MGDTYAEHTKQRYENTVRDTAQALRSIADDFERRGLDLHGGAARTAAAGRAIHTLQWGLANASIERLIADAVLADAAQADKEAKK